MQHASNAPLSNKLILMVAPNGARRMKADHPAIPISAVELANCSTEILEAGASVIHLHVRDNQGRHSLDPEHYKDAIKQIKHQVGKKLIIQITTEAVGIYTIEQQIHCVREVKPEAISVALREICPDELSEHVAADFFKWCADQCIWVQIILYSVDEVLRYKELSYV